MMMSLRGDRTRGTRKTATQAEDEIFETDKPTGRRSEPRGKEVPQDITQNATTNCQISDETTEEVEVKPDIGEEATSSLTIDAVYHVPSVDAYQSCCVGGCSNTSGGEGEGIKLKYYTFPDCQLSREKWIYFVRISRQTATNNKGIKWQPTNTSFICSQHFVGGERSDDELNDNCNPSILHPTNINLTDSNPPSTHLREGTRDVFQETEDKTICTMCLSESGLRSTAKSYLLFPNFSEFCNQILKSEQSTQSFLNALSSFGNMTVCRPCLTMISTVVRQNAEINLLERSVHKLQLQLLNELKHLHKLVADYCWSMGEIRNSISTSDLEQIRKHLTSEQQRQTDMDYGGNMEKILEFREKIVRNAENVQNTNNWLDGKVNCDGNPDRPTGQATEMSEHFILPDIHPPIQPEVRQESNVNEGRGEHNSEVTLAIQNSYSLVVVPPASMANMTERGRVGRNTNMKGNRHTYTRKINPKIRICPTCGKDMSYMKADSHRYRHIRICREGFQYKCDLCPKTLNRKDNFQRHKKTCMRRQVPQIS